MEKNKRKLLGWTIGLLVLFFALTGNVLLTGPLTVADEQIMQWVMSVRNSVLTDVFLFFTFMGSMSVIVYFGIVVLLVLSLFKQGRSMQFLFVSVVGAELLNRTLKIAIGRMRPDAMLSLTSSDGYAFPSGHAAAATTFYGALLFIIWPWCQNRWQKNLAAFLVGMMIFLVGLSRIYLGVHWATDVVGGWLFGIMILLITLMLHKR
ncbi:MAG: phosphatase PAP2 family protein [Parcubacteria group bacterium]